MEVEVIDFILSKSKLKISDEEKNEMNETLNILLEKPLITEKTLTFKTSEDNYNIGNYFINKDRDAESSSISISAKFRDKYFNKTENEIYLYLKKKNLSGDKINKYLILYNLFVAKRIKINREIPMKDIMDYIID